MSKYYKKNVAKDISKKFCDETVKRISRIESINSVIGVMFIQNGDLQMYTVPEALAHGLSKKLPALNRAMHSAVTEIDIQNELVAYRIQTKNVEISVVAGREFAAAVVHRIISNLLKDSKDEWLVSTTSTINHVNPMVDRLMDDESVEGVIMTNKDGIPVLTNVSVITANSYAICLHRFGTLAQNYIKELDVLDDVLIVRLKTKKKEVMLAPDPEFNIIVVQNARLRSKDSLKKKEKRST